MPEPVDTVNTILAMYREGWFPMSDGHRVDWYKPRTRLLIPLDHRFHISGTLRAKVRSRRFVVRGDHAFSQVIRACAEPGPGRPETWLSPSIARAFELLHQAGHAHCVEAYLSDANGKLHLVGGLYGLAIGAAFCGESMFSRPELGGTDASKVCLVHLVAHLRRQGFAILDAQLENPHLNQFGAFTVSAAEYDALLPAAAT